MSNQSTKSDDMNDDGMLNAEMQRKLPQGKISQPKLRFKGFTDPWQQRKLGELGFTYSGLSGKNKSDFGHGSAYFVTYLNVFSNPIADCYGIEAVEIDDKQHKVITGDIFFTASSETPEDVGMTSLWLGAQDNLYLNSFCFGYRMTANHNSIFMAYSLRSPQFRSKIQLLAQGISRFNISKKKVMELISTFPSLSEQIRIGEFFRVLDDLIAAAKKKADLLKLKKRYYLQAIFSQQLRFKGFTGPWQQRKYSDYLIESNIPGHDGSEANKLTVKLWGKGVVEKETVTAGSNATKYYIRHTGQLMYGKLDFLHAAFGLVPPELDGYESTADSPAFDILPSADPNFILMTCLSEHTYLYQGNLADGSRKAKRVHVPTFLDMSLNVPNIEEQRRIVSFLHIIDKLIAAANHKAELLIQQKNAYLQRLFV